MSDYQKDIERILVVNVNWLGDVVFSTPVFKALKKNYPAASLSCLCVPGVRDIVECVPGVDDIIVYDEKGRDRSVFAKWALVERIRAKNFDAVFLLHNSWSRAVLAALAGIPIRVGYQDGRRNRFLTHPVEPPLENWHKSDIYMNVIESFGIPVWDRRCELKVPDLAQTEVAGILSRKGVDPCRPYAVVHTTGNWDLKRWPQEYWAELLRAFHQRTGCPVVISEGPRERGIALKIAELSGVPVVVLAGETTLHQLLALLEKAAVVVSGDSGPLHIASCVSGRVLGLYGPTVPETTEPRGKARSRVLFHDVGCNRASCYYLACPENVCMKAVSVDEVLKAMVEILESLRIER